METVQEFAGNTGAMPRTDESVRIQSGAYLLELSLDWIVLRASENIHGLVRESHVSLIDEPLGKFVHSQALHDLRNLFSRLSGTTGIGRAYSVRLTDSRELFDIAFQVVDGRVLLEAVPSSSSYGEFLGSVGGLIAGLSNSHGQALLDGAARRMRALTGYDRVTLRCGDRRAESSRGAFSGAANPTDLPIVIADVDADVVGIFPRDAEESSAGAALLRAPSPEQRQRLAELGIRAIVHVSFEADEVSSEFCCESRRSHGPSFELHAAADLYAQMFALRLELDSATNH